MHVPDGFVSGGVNAITYIISAGISVFAVREANKKLGDKQVPLLGVVAAFIFAAQMLNFPVAGGTSGHFLGALLAASLLGPWMSCLIMTVVLTIQCLLFADGGLTALGTNIFNMGIIGGVLCYYILVALKSIFPKNKSGYLVSVAISSLMSVVLGASACAVELAISGTSPLGIVLPAMASVHVLIGIGEAIITTAVVGLILNTRPDLVGTYSYQDAGTFNTMEA
ncbi:MAG: cobalamin biosynthesis protein CbiM [Deltaproteobacteria bacterium]|nr:MAG: cobalamin biosynthesis protein CbiM [Deltaproteobacteria bacterium]